MPGAFAIFVISLSLGQAARTLPEIGREVGTEPAVVLLKSGKGFKGHIQVAPNGQSLRHLRLGKDPEYACAEIQSVAMERKGRRVKRNLARWGLGFGVLMAGSAVAMAGGEGPAWTGALIVLGSPFVGYYGGAGLVPVQLNVFTPACGGAPVEAPKPDGPKP